MADKKSNVNLDELKGRYGDKLYTVNIDIEVDDSTTDHKSYIFKRPSTPSYDRFIKGMSTSSSKSAKAFALDNVIDEQREQLTADLEEYPAMSVTITDKLTSMLGLAKDTSVKKL